MALSRTRFKTVSETVPASDTMIYGAPSRYNALVLTCQVVNTDGADPHSVSLYLKREDVMKPLLVDYSIVEKEILNILGGSLGALVLEPGDSLYVSGDSLLLNVTLSVLETLKT